MFTCILRSPPCCSGILLPPGHSNPSKCHTHEVRRTSKTCRAYHANAQEFLSGTRSCHDLWQQLTYTSKHRSWKTRSGLRVATGFDLQSTHLQGTGEGREWSSHALPGQIFHLRYISIGTQNMDGKHYVKADKADQNEKPTTSYI